MADRHKTHNGRDVDGHFKVKREDVEDLLERPDGVDILRDDVRLGGAIEDTGLDAGMHGRHVGELIEDNRADIDRVTGRTNRSRGKRGGKR